ncbi:hypothetical protein AVEN_104029-1 [Araneus ventricosus]|uniref:Uncharacterized protein n=1 Tax=Araneus ventricosus TaxID=182803 RepID=A0A4Y2TGB5_ARAVE|nr:hypothetical protein AVEN_104029-1 [Araneus ventricosus]
MDRTPKTFAQGDSIVTLFSPSLQLSPYIVLQWQLTSHGDLLVHSSVSHLLIEYREDSSTFEIPYFCCDESPTVSKMVARSGVQTWLLSINLMLTLGKIMQP